MNIINILQGHYWSEKPINRSLTIWLQITILTVLMSANGLLFAAYGAVTELPKLQLNKGGVINAMVELPDGGVIIGGAFTQINGKEQNAIAKIKTDGTLDEAWDPLIGSDHDVYSLLLDGDSLYVGGAFYYVGGKSRRGIARLDVASAEVDPDWNPVEEGDYSSRNVYAMVMSGTEHIFIGGYFEKLGGEEINAVAKLSTLTGDADADWDPRMKKGSRVYAMQLSGDVLFVGGQLTEINEVVRKGIAKLSAVGTGALDMEWDPRANGSIRSLALSETGDQLYVGGGFIKIGCVVSGTDEVCVDRNGIARLNTSGVVVVDGAWDPNASIPGYTVDIKVLSLADSLLYVGGFFSEIGGQSRNAIALLSTANATADGWNPDAGKSARSKYVEIRTLLLTSDGSKVHLGGTFNTMGGNDALLFATVEKSTGDLVAGFEDFDIGNTGEINALVKSGNDLYFGGHFVRVNGEPLHYLGKIDGTTGQVADWGAGFDDRVLALAVDGTSVYAGGYFTNIGELERNHIAKLSAADGSVDANWDPNAGGTVFVMLLKDNDLYVAGTFSRMSDTPQGIIAKLAVDTGDLVPDWNPGPNSSVNALALSGTDLYIGGNFSKIGEVEREKVAKLDTTTAVVDPTWVAEKFDQNVLALAVDGGALFVGGHFTEIGGLTRNRVAKLSTADAAVDTTWDPDVNQSVNTLALSTDGVDLYIGGRYSQVGDTNRNAIAQVLASTGDLDMDWNPSAVGRSAVLALAVSESGIYAGGQFSKIGGKNTALGHIVDGHLLTVTVTTTSNEARKGVITSTPDGILCSLQTGTQGCERALVAGDFTLKATIDDPYITISQEWLSGCVPDAGSPDTCDLPLDENKTVEVELSCDTYDIPKPDEPVSYMKSECNSIKVAQGFTVGDAGRVTFIATKSVELGPNFRVSATPGYFKIEIP